MLRALARGSRIIVVGICKAALLVSLLSVGVEIEGKASEGESEVSFESEWLHSGEGSRRECKQVPLRIVGCMPITRGWITASHRRTYAPQSDGHRLANGLLAPLTC